MGEDNTIACSSPVAMPGGYGPRHGSQILAPVGSKVLGKLHSHLVSLLSYLSSGDKKMPASWDYFEN